MNEFFRPHIVLNHSPSLASKVVMGFDVERFVNPVNEGLLCCICRDVLEDPLQAPCEHAYCSTCINGWLVHENCCPEDRRLLFSSQLKPPFRYLCTCSFSCDIKKFRLMFISDSLVQLLTIQCQYTHQFALTAGATSHVSLCVTVNAVGACCNYQLFPCSVHYYGIIL